jgi:hypothetical protein
VQDPAVPEVGEVADRHVDAGRVVGGDRGDVQRDRAAVDHDEVDPLLVQLLQQRVLQQCRRHDEPLDLARPQGRDLRPLALGVVVGVDDERAEGCAAQDVLDTADDRREQRVGDVGQDQPDGARLRRLEAAGDGVGLEAERLGRTQHAAGRVRADQPPGLGIQGTRRRGRVDACRLRDIAQGRGAHDGDPKVDPAAG